MENDYRLLGIDKNSTTDRIKHAYYEKIKTYTPEMAKDKFIKINNAYERILYAKKYDDDILESIVNCINSAGNNSLYLYINKLIDSININNFTVKNENILNTIMLLKNRGNYAEALFLAYKVEMKFRKLGLSKLSDAYIELEKNIIEEKN